MRIHPLAIVAAFLLSAGALATGAGADVIPALPRCAPWEDTERLHGTARCVPRACRRNAQCSGASCRTRRVCVVSEEVFVSIPGPCRDLDGDGACDRRRERREREAGACPAEGRCGEGVCQTRGTCEPR